MRAKSAKTNVDTSELSIEDDERSSHLIDDYVTRNRDALNASIRKSRKELASGKISTRSIDDVIDDGLRRHGKS